MFWEAGYFEFGDDDVKLSNFYFSFRRCQSWPVVCGLAAKQSAGLRLTAWLSHFLLAPSPLCSGSPQHPDPGKCTRPARSRPQTGWPDGKTRAAFSARLPIAAVRLSLGELKAKENKQRDFSSSSCRTCHLKCLTKMRKHTFCGVGLHCFRQVLGADEFLCADAWDNWRTAEGWKESWRQSFQPKSRRLWRENKLIAFPTVCCRLLAALQCSTVFAASFILFFLWACLYFLTVPNNLPGGS